MAVLHPLEGSVGEFLTTNMALVVDVEGEERIHKCRYPDKEVDPEIIYYLF